MNHSTKQIAQALAPKQDIKETFRLQLEQVVNQLLESELAIYLDYEVVERLISSTATIL